MKNAPKNLKELDKWIKENPCKDGSLDSRYGALKKIYGERIADKIMRELEVKSWKL